MSKKKSLTTFETLIAWKLTEGIDSFPGEHSMPLATALPMVQHLAKHLARTLTAEDLVRSGFARERQFGHKPSRRTSNAVDLLRAQVVPPKARKIEVPASSDHGDAE